MTTPRFDRPLHDREFQEKLTEAMVSNTDTEITMWTNNYIRKILGERGFFKKSEVHSGKNVSIWRRSDGSAVELVESESEPPKLFVFGTDTEITDLTHISVVNPNIQNDGSADEHNG